MKAAGKRRALPLGARLAATTMLVLLVASSLVSWRLSGRERERLIASKMTAAGMVCRLITTNLAAALEFGDLDDIRAQVGNLKTSADIAAIAIWRIESGELVAEWQVPGVGPLSSPNPQELDHSYVVADYVEVVTAIRSHAGEPTAHLKIAFSLRAENDAYRASRLLLLWMSLLMAAGVATPLILITRLQIIGPLSRLREAVGQFERGELGARVAVRSNDEIGALALAFNRMGDAVAARQSQVEAAELRFRVLIETMPDAVLLCQSGRITYANPSFAQLVGAPAADFIGKETAAALPGQNEEAPSNDTLGPSAAMKVRGEQWQVGGKSLLVEVRRRGLIVDAVVSDMIIARDMTEHRQLQAHVLESDKLAAIGTLAAGVAHEINTPVQFVSDSIHFVRDVMVDLLAMVDLQRVVCRSALDGAASVVEAARRATAKEEEVDLPYILENAPAALDRSLEGLKRIATIVRSLKVFAHSSEGMAAADINDAIRSTLEVARHEFKYVAELETDLGELPPVVCNVGDINQALLNIVVNAAHAVSDVVEDSGGKGVITVRTRQDGEFVTISIADTGSGISDAIGSRIFEPFFTTKEVGRGTGQGLSIARSAIVERNGGELTFESAPGQGTTFFIRIPIHGKDSQSAAARGEGGRPTRSAMS